MKHVDACTEDEVLLTILHLFKCAAFPTISALSTIGSFLKSVNLNIAGYRLETKNLKA